MISSNPRSGPGSGALRTAHQRQGAWSDQWHRRLAGVKPRSGRAHRFRSRGWRILASADAFFQASAGLLDRFVRHVVHLAGLGRPTYAVELYSGIGLFTVPLASHVGQIDAVEASESAVELARRNVQRNCLRNVDFHAESAERWIARHVRKSPRPETIVVDPPRIGLSDVVLSGTISIEPNRIVYVSCDPATFARDARRIVDTGYRMMSLTVFDLFPQTHHTETVAAFDIKFQVRRSCLRLARVGCG